MAVIIVWQSFMAFMKCFWRSGSSSEKTSSRRRMGLVPVFSLIYLISASFIASRRVRNSPLEADELIFLPFMKKAMSSRCGPVVVFARKMSRVLRLKSSSL